MRRSRSLGFLVGLLGAILFLGARPAAAQIIQKVIDGDTVVVSGVGTVRLIGIDSPETVDPRKMVQRFGKEASAFLHKLAEGKPVRLEYDVTRWDKYRRTLAYLYLSDGTFINAEMIRQGYANAYTEFPFKYVQQFLAFEREAREARRGLWADSSNDSPRALAAVSNVANAAEVVYVTRTGKQYHREGCSHLARSQVKISLKDAVGHYTPCKVCKPPTLGTNDLP